MPEGTSLYEYASMCQVGRLPEMSKWNKAGDAQRTVAAADMIKTALDKAVGAMESLDGGNWEIVSHNLAIYGSWAVMSFVCRRPKF